MDENELTENEPYWHIHTAELKKVDCSYLSLTHTEKALTALYLDFQS